MRAPLTPATAGRAVGVSVRVDMSGNRFLADDLQAEALEAHDALLGVGQEHHFLDPEIDQDLGADAIVAKLAARWPDALAAAPALLTQHDRRRFADQHQDAP